MSRMNGNPRVFVFTRVGAARAGLAATIAALALSCGEYFPNAFLTTGDEIVLKAAPFGFSPLIEPHVPAQVGTLVPLAKANYWFVNMQSDDGADLEAARADPGASLAEFELYQQGRACFLANDQVGARAAWERILALPRAERQWRSTWAAYMLGRSWHTRDPARAAQHYAQTRELAAQGFADGHFRVDNPHLAGKSVTFSLPTTGYENIRINYDSAGLGAGSCSSHASQQSRSSCC